MSKHPFEAEKIEVEKHCELWKACDSCMISEFAFQKVFFDGSYRPYWLFIGEGPGVSEDAIGQPFVGPSGRLLREAIDKTGFPRSAVAFTNLVACRPTDGPKEGNRAPDSDEVEACSDRLRGIINILKPKILVGVGKVPANYLSDNFTLPMRSIYHPAFILRRGGSKAKEYKDWLRSLKRIKEGTSHD